MVEEDSSNGDYGNKLIELIKSEPEKLRVIFAVMNLCLQEGKYFSPMSMRKTFDVICNLENKESILKEALEAEKEVIKEEEEKELKEKSQKETELTLQSDSQAQCKNKRKS